MILQPLKQTIYNWIKSRVDSSVTIYEMEQGAPRAPRPAVSYKIVTPSVKPYDDDIRFDADTKKFSVNGPRTMLMSLNSYGVDALEIMMALQNSVDDPDAISQLASGGVAIVQTGAVENLTELLESNFETRAHMDMVFGYNIDNKTNVVEIDKVSINGEDIPSSP